ncbi:hypothetical protein BD311DRAFT_518953 [Dichomitus squalens]|uniref:Uncharacterized protein n=1 Tax=Dichomitus squalens TaxID=114155 RepID=A0A4Q9MH45_9APHY|nr:hypothetical protein BD311DRAFT_518953 [Dichomitus squalens]
MSLLSLDERSAQVLQVGLPDAFGTFMIGSFLGILLYGVSTHQAYRYIRSFPTDAAYIRLLVILVMILETLYVIFNIHTCFHFLIWNYAHPEGLKHSTWSLDTLPMLTGLVVVVAQIFFVRRVSLIGPRHRILARIVGGALVGELGFSIAASVLSFIGRPALVSVLSAAALLIASIADTILMLALVHAIRTSRSRESQQAAESPLDVAQVYIINSGIITGIFHYLAFITAITLPSGSLLWVAFVTLAELTSPTSRIYGTHRRKRDRELSPQAVTHPNSPIRGRAQHVMYDMQSIRLRGVRRAGTLEPLLS